MPSKIMNRFEYFQNALLETLEHIVIFNPNPVVHICLNTSLPQLIIFFLALSELIIQRKKKMVLEPKQLNLIPACWGFVSYLLIVRPLYELYEVLINNVCFHVYESRWKL